MSKTSRKRSTYQYLLRGIRGGTAINTTAEMLRLVANTPGIDWPLAGGLRAHHLSERAELLDGTDKVLNEMLAKLDSETEPSEQPVTPESREGRDFQIEAIKEYRKDILYANDFYSLKKAMIDHSHRLQAMLGAEP